VQRSRLELVGQVEQHVHDAVVVEVDHLDAVPLVILDVAAGGLHALDEREGARAAVVPHPEIAGVVQGQHVDVPVGVEVAERHRADARSGPIHLGRERVAVGQEQREASRVPRDHVGVAVAVQVRDVDRERVPRVQRGRHHDVVEPASAIGERQLQAERPVALVPHVVNPDGDDDVR
jgi:hypothetical protein